jgi:hypothetical protein
VYAAVGAHGVAQTGAGAHGRYAAVFCPQQWQPAAPIAETASADKTNKLLITDISIATLISSNANP